MIVIPNYVSNAESVSDMLSMFTTFIAGFSFLNIFKAALKVLDRLVFAPHLPCSYS